MCSANLATIGLLQIKCVRVIPEEVDNEGIYLFQLTFRLNLPICNVVYV